MLFFGSLGVLEVHGGLQRLEGVRDRRRRDLLGVVDRQQEALVREVSEQIGDGRRHASHLARHPFVHELLATAPGEAPGATRDLGRILLPYLASFPEIDRLRVVDGEARERYRCERMGGGVATLPARLLDPSASPELVELCSTLRGSDVLVSRVMYDAERVEVEPADRRVFHLIAPVQAGGAALGAVVVTVYAAPLLRALTGFEPVPGTTTCLLDAGGATFAPTAVGGDVVQGCARLLESAPRLRSRVVGGETGIETPEAFLLARATGVEPASFVVTCVPRAALLTGSLAGEELRTVLRTLLVLLAIGLGSAFFVRASHKAARLLETERYARRIREESGKQRALMDAAADMILIVEPETELVQDWNPRARELFGIAETGADLPLGAIASRFESDGGERLREGIGIASAGAEQPVQLAGLVHARKGARCDLDARCVGIDYAGKRLVELSFSDRTRERDMERRARTAERLSALGLLTAGVAHEINNPLEGIANYLTLLERTDDPELRAKYTAQVRRGFDRIREITSELLPLARPVHGEASSDLRQVVERATSMAHFPRELHDVEIRVEGLDVPYLVAGGGGGLEQVLLNLLLNAGRAMDGRGRILVKGERLPGNRLEIAIEDEGPGIAEEDLERVFDPFFTKSGGTGLGLSISYQIVQAHGGELTAENRAGGGARFVLRLPLLGTGAVREEEPA